MSYERAELTVTGRLSRHNDPRDDDHNRAWNSFAAAIQELAARPEFTDIELQVDAEHYEIEGWEVMELPAQPSKLS